MASSRINGVNENISTYGAVGFGRDYTALGTWESATDNNLVSSEVSEVLFICKDQAEYDDKVSITGATTSADYRRIIRGAYTEDQTGLPSAMVLMKITSSSFNASVFSIAENYLVIQDVSASNQITAGGATGCFYIQTGAYQGIYFIGCLATSTHPTSGIGFRFGGTAGTNGAINCLAYNNADEGFSFVGGDDQVAYNCTAVGNGGSGFSRSSGTVHVINCLASGNGTDFDTSAFGIGSWSAFNAASDTSTWGSAPSGRVSQTFTFQDADNDDYHLAQNDAGARGYGGNMTLSTINPYTDEGIGFEYDDDVDREQVAVWSIGFDSDGQFADDAEPCECPGTTGEVSTANGALGYLGVSLITEFGESTKQGQLIQRLLPDVRKRLQQQYRWEFCLRRASYTSADVVAGVPTWGFTYAFLLPSNMLQLWDVGEPHDNPRYRMENKYLLIDDSSVDILYSVEVTDPDLWSASFAEAMELKMASKLAMPLLHKPELMQLYEGLFQDKVADAIFLNDIQSDDFSAYSSHLMSARRGFSPREIPLDLS